MRIPTFSQFKLNSDNMLQQLSDMNHYMSQITTGKRLLASSEDPVLASQIKTQSTYVDDIQNYYDNGVIAQNRMNLFSTINQSSINAISDVKTLIIKAQNSTLSDQGRQALAIQLQGDLSILLNNANTTDSNGAYIYSGFNSNVQPYSEVNGNYQYNGGLTRSYIDIGQGANALYYENGFNVFGNIYDGNGTFSIQANNANTGSAFALPGSVVNQAAYVADTYTLTFVTNSLGQLAYQVVGANSGQVIPPLPAATPANAPQFVPDQNISFNGLSFSVSGGAAVGDKFTIQPSTQQNVFNTLQSLITTLKNPVTNQGQFNQTMSQISASFGQISSHFLNYQSQLGSMSISVDQVIQSNKSSIFNAQITLSSMQDAPLEEVVPKMLQKQMSLQAASDSYVKLEQTLMQILKL